MEGERSGVTTHGEGEERRKLGVLVSHCCCCSKSNRTRPCFKQPQEPYLLPWLPFSSYFWPLPLQKSISQTSDSILLICHLLFHPREIFLAKSYEITIRSFWNNLLNVKTCHSPTTTHLWNTGFLAGKYLWYIWGWSHALKKNWADKKPSKRKGLGATGPHTLAKKGNLVQKIFAKNTSVIWGFLILVNEYSLTFKGKKREKKPAF